MDTLFSQKLFDFYRKVYVSMEKLYEKVLADESLSVVQLRLILIIRTCGEIPVGRLSQRAGMNSGNCSSMCKKMEQMGLIERKRGTDDERIVSLGLTEKGNAVAGRVLDKIRRLHEHFYGNIREDEMNTIIQSMDIVTNYLDHLV